MKTTTFKLISCMLLFASVFTACDDADEGNYIVDFYPIDVEVFVTDAKGVNLLDPSVPNSIINSDIQLVYNKETYQLDKAFQLDYPKSRAYLPMFSGLTLRTIKGGQPYLNIGEFDGAQDCVKRSFVIEWGDGTKSEISYSNKAIEKGKDSRAERSFYLDGKEVENPITIVK